MSGHKSGSQGGGRSREYVVFNGRQTGTFNSWSDTKEQVSGYPHNCYERVKSDNSQYVVHEGRNPGVYDSWNEAHKQVSGYPNNSYEKVKGGKY